MTTKATKLVSLGRAAAAITFTRNNNRGSNHATAGKLVNRVSNNALLRSWTLAPLLVLIVSSGLAFAASSASADEPWYHVESGSRPTYLPPPEENEEGEFVNGKGEIIVTVSNLGNANTTGAVTIANALPAGVKAVSMKAQVKSLEGGGSASEELECPS